MWTMIYENPYDIASLDGGKQVAYYKMGPYSYENKRKIEERIEE